VLLLVALLHTRHQVSFRACGLILICLNFVFAALPGDLLGPEPMPSTLKTVFSRLGLKNDRFREYIVCYQCHKLFNGDVETNMLCPGCGAGLFRPATEQLFESIASNITGTTLPKRKPHLVAPIQVLSEGLREFFERPGMAPAMNLWKVRPQVAGECRTIQDGKIWNTIKGADGHRFFFGPGNEKEIRLGVTFSLDWYVF
jgi:hypothetical protein